MEEDKRIIAPVFALVVVLSFLFGGIISVSRFKYDTYDCTVKCPNMARSIEVDQTCYCEVK